MPTTESTPAKPETTRHRIREIPGQTTPAGQPAPAKPAKAKKPAAKKAAAPKATKPVRIAKPKAAAKGETKADIVVRMLRRPEGATSAQLEKATGWQAHSIRGFFAGTLKKKRSMTVTSEKADGVRTYRLPAVDAAPEAPEAV